MALGLEEELHVVDLATGALVPRGDELLAAAKPALGDLLTRELNLCQVETASPICDRLDEVAGHLRSSRRALLDAGRDVGLGVVALGTHPRGRWEDQQVDRSRPRYRALTEQYQALAHEHIICGCHIHVGFDDPDERFGAMTRLRRWLPVLLALSANSPFWQAEDTGYASYRHHVWRRWPTSGLPPQVESEADYDGIVEELVAAGAIDDGRNLYWDLRPSARYPTLEIRAFDTLLQVEDAAAVAGLVRALVWTAARDGRRGAPVEDLRAEVLESAMWRAARDGVHGELLSPGSGEVAPARDVVAEVLSHCEEGLRVHDDLETVTAGIEAILRRGTGADRQRAAAAAHGSDEAALVGELLAWTSGHAPGSRTAA